jgi:hypothetical protein
MSSETTEADGVEHYREVVAPASTTYNGETCQIAAAAVALGLAASSSQVSTHPPIRIFVYVEFWIFGASNFRPFASNPLFQEALQYVREISAFVLLEQDCGRLTLR